MPAVILVGVNPASLTAGTYQGGVTILTGVVTTRRVAVILTVTQAQPGTISAGNASVSFGVTVGAGATTSSLTLTNSGGAAVNYTSTVDFQGGPSFLTLSAPSGTVTPTQPATLTLTANPQSLAIGTYKATINFKGDNGQTLAVPVTLTVSATAQKLVISQGALSFMAVQGSTPAAQTFSILNTGLGVLSWTASASALSGSTQWLSIDKTAGNVLNPFTDISPVTVKVNPAGLSAGDYFGQITVVSAGAASSPQVIPVTLSVVTADPGLDVSTAGLIFTGAASSQDVLITNRTGRPINFTTSQSGVGFTYSPSDGVADPSKPTTIHVSSDFSKVPPGDFRRGTITVSFADGSVRTISVLSVVGPLTGK